MVNKLISSNIFPTIKEINSFCNDGRRFKLESPNAAQMFLHKYKKFDLRWQDDTISFLFEPAQLEPPNRPYTRQTTIPFNPLPKLLLETTQKTKSSM